jgi:hypothetical protein
MDGPLVLIPTVQALSTWIVRHDAERPAIAQDDTQRQSGGWQLTEAQCNPLESDRFLCAYGRMEQQAVALVG